MNDPRPPKLAEKLLLRFIKEDLAEEVLGDLDEKYNSLLEKHPKKANRNYWYQVLNYIRPFALKKTKSKYSKLTIMFNNNFKVAWRSMKRQKMYSAIKIGGFAIGIMVCLLILLYINDDLSYDQQYQEKHRVYRLVNHMNDPNDTERWTSFSPAIKKVLESDYPEIETVGRLIPFDWFNGGNNQMRPEGQDIITYEEGFMYADPELLDILEVQMIYGSTENALSNPKSILISENKASKYFPGENPIGKTIILNEDTAAHYTVGGVMKNFPKNSHLQTDFLLTLVGEEFWPGEQSSWCCSNYNTYLRLYEGSNPAQLENKLLSIRDNHLVPHFRERGNLWADELEKFYSIELQGVTDIHLRSTDIHSEFSKGDITMVWLFGIIAIIVLALASINFINLSTAKSANRAKEVGLRKVIGSGKSTLIFQFLTESILYSLVSFILAIILAVILLPYFNIIAEKSLSIPFLEWWFIPLIIASAVIIGVISGVYPAFYLTAFKPLNVLRGDTSRGSKSAGLRSILVVFQFTASILLIIGAVVVNEQMNYITRKKVGFDKDQILIIHGTNTLGQKAESFKNEIKQLSSVEEVSYSNSLPVEGTMRNNNQFWIEGTSTTKEGVGAQIWGVDEDYVKTMGFKVVMGKDFDPTLTTGNPILINQTMAKELGVEDPVGVLVTNKFEPPYRIVGVIEDFHYETMRDEILSLCLRLQGGNSLAAVRFNPQNVDETLSKATEIWEQFAPNQAIRYSFMDEKFNAMYKDVQRTSRIFNIFSILAVFVACTGLFGLSGFMAEQRRKEISIRKVLGASVHSIFRLLSSNFIRLVLISFIIAAPIGYHYLEKWLEDFEYRIPLSWGFIAMAGGIGLLVALITVSFESLKAGFQNPVQGLRSE